MTREEYEAEKAKLKVTLGPTSNEAVGIIFGLAHIVLELQRIADALEEMSDEVVVYQGETFDVRDVE